MRRLLTVIAALALLAGCGSDPEPELLPLPPTPSAQPSESPTPTPQPSTKTTTPSAKASGTKTVEASRTPEKTRTSKPADAGSVLPANLVGDWETVTPNGNAFSYTFLANGKYVYFGLMKDGDLQYQLTEGGRASISGGRITFKPQLVEMVRTEAGASSTTNPQRDPRQLGFKVSGNRLTFTDTDGSGSVYHRA